MKNYSVKNIVFGFRGEYLEFQRRVNSLKDYILCEKDYDLYVTKNNDADKFDLVCTFNTGEKRKNSDRYKTVAGVIYEGNSKTPFENGNIKIKDKDALIDRMNELDNSLFGQDMAMCEPLTIKTNEYNSIKNLIIWSNLIEFRETDRFLNLKKSVFYSPYEDKVYFETTDWFKKADKHLVDSVLYEEVPEYHFRSYHKDILDDYKERSLIIINEQKENKCTGYSIKQDDKVLLLKR